MGDIHSSPDPSAAIASEKPISSWPRNPLPVAKKLEKKRLFWSVLNPPPRFFCQIPWSQNVHQIFCRHIHRFHWHPYFVPSAPQKKTGTLAGVNTNPARNTRGSLPPPFWGASNIIYPSPSSDSSPPQKNVPARDPKQFGEQEVNVPDTSNSSHGTETDQVRQFRNCSSRNLFWHKKQRYVYSSGPHTRASYQDM